MKAVELALAQEITCCNIAITLIDWFRSVMPGLPRSGLLRLLPGRRGVRGYVCIAKASAVVAATWFHGAGYQPIKSVAELGRQLATVVVEVVN